MNPAAPTKDTFVSVQALRAVAALMVLMCHIGAIEGLYTGHQFLPAWGMYGVDVFFVISGFVMTYTSSALWEKKGVVRPFLLKRFWRIYPVYWEFTAVILVMLWCFPQMLHMSGDLKPSVVKSLLLWPQATDPLLGVGWSLVYEMYFYVIFAFALLLPLRVVKQLAFAWAGLLCISLAVGLNTPPPTLVAPAMPMQAQWPEWDLLRSAFALEFLLGCAAASLIRRGVRFPVGLLVAVALLWGAGVSSLSINGQTEAVRVVSWAIPCAALLYGALMLERYHGIKFPAWPAKLGDASYSLYLSHSLLLSAMGKLWQHLHVPGLLAHAVFVIACVIVTITFSLLNYSFFEKPLSRWYHTRVSR